MKSTWLAHLGYNEANYDMVYGQISLIPRALVDDKGFPFHTSLQRVAQHITSKHITSKKGIKRLM